MFNRVETVCSQSVYACMLMTTAVIELVLDRVLADINNIFGDMSLVRGREHDFFGMVFDFTRTDCCRVSMLTFVPNSHSLNALNMKCGLCRTFNC